MRVYPDDDESTIEEDLEADINLDDMDYLEKGDNGKHETK